MDRLTRDEIKFVKGLKKTEDENIKEHEDFKKWLKEWVSNSLKVSGVVVPLFAILEYVSSGVVRIEMIGLSVLLGMVFSSVVSQFYGDGK